MRQTLLALLAAIAVCWSGCERPVEKSGAAPRGGDASTSRWEEPDATTVPTPQRVVNLETPRERVVATLPEVRLTAEAEATCLVRVGDTFPETLLVPRGHPTVVAFWQTSNTPRVRLRTEEMLRDIPELLGKIAAEQVAFVSLDILCDIAGGDTPDTAATIFASVVRNATPPRLFVLDAAGRIVWLDVEYSVATREQLEHAVRYLIAQTPTP